MNYKILAFAIALSIGMMGSVLFFVVSQGAKQAQAEVFAQQETLGLLSPDVTQGLFGVTTPSFAQDTVSCTQPPFVHEAYVNVVLRYRETPRSCSFWVNDLYVQTTRDLAPNCVRECPTGEFSRTIPLGTHDVRDNHVVRVCCNDICVEHMLQNICGFSGENQTTSR